MFSGKWGNSSKRDLDKSRIFGDDKSFSLIGMVDNEKDLSTE